MHECAQPAVQIWISHDDQQIRRVGGRILEIPSGKLLDELP
jgi:hypothetical protein